MPGHLMLEPGDIAVQAIDAIVEFFRLCEVMAIEMLECGRAQHDEIEAQFLFGELFLQDLLVLRIRFPASPPDKHCCILANKRLTRLHQMQKGLGEGGLVVLGLNAVQ